MCAWDLQFNVCIVQPPDNVHALGFLDQARYFQYQFQRLGCKTDIRFNQLCHDSINILFGAHGGLDEEFCAQYRCAIVNLEQLGDNGAKVNESYMRLLRNSVVIDYDRSNTSAYCSSGDIPLVTFGYAPYLRPPQLTPIEDRPIDVLFVGSMNQRRHRMLQEIQLSGNSVTLLRVGVYGDDRDQKIRRAKAVFNCHFYESARFEQARVFQCLSLGTPVISERSRNTNPPSIFEECVFWTPKNEIQSFFEHKFLTPKFFDAARNKLLEFSTQDVSEQYAAVVDYLKNRFSI